MDFRLVPFGDAPPGAAELLWAGGRPEGSWGWYETLAKTTLGPGETALAALAEAGRDVRAVLVLARARNGALRGLSAPYTTWFGPAAADAVAAEFLGRSLRAAVSGVLTLDALDPAHVPTAALLAGLESSGLVTERYDHFRNWHETIVDFDAYWSARDARLRETVRRKRKRLEQSGRLAFTCLRTPPDVAAAMADYESVYESSWKPPEPHPDFMARLAAALAREGTFRLGLARIDGKPAAAQIWLVRDGRATIFKLAHAPLYDTHSPGTILTHWMLSDLCARGEIAELDLGRGDDAYKRLWLGDFSRRIGFIAGNSRRFTGLYHIARHIWPTRAGRLLRRGGRNARP